MGCWWGSHMGRHDLSDRAGLCERRTLRTGYSHYAAITGTGSSSGVPLQMSGFTYFRPPMDQMVVRRILIKRATAV